MKWYEANKNTKTVKKVVDVVPSLWLDQSTKTLFWPPIQFLKNFDAHAMPDTETWDPIKYTSILYTSEDEQDCHGFYNETSSEAGLDSSIIRQRKKGTMFLGLPYVCRCMLSCP